MKLQVKLNLILFLIIIFGFGAVNLLRPHSQEVSKLEQRNIATQPEFTADRYFAGAYTRDFDNYFSDNFAFRTSLVQVGASLKGLKGLPDENGISIVVSGGNNMAVDMNAKGESSSVTAVNSSDYLILKDRAYTAFKYSAPAAELYADALNRFRKSVDSKVRVYSLLAPTSVEFSKNKNVQKLSDSQKNAIAHVNERLDAAIGQVEAYGVLNDHSEEYIYFRTDHHWTALGAYYAYTNLMKKMGETPVPLSKYQKNDINQFLGTAYKQLLDNRLKTHPDTLTYYTPYTKYMYTLYTSTGKAMTRKVVDPNYAKYSSTFYAVFLGGDYPWGEITTNNNNGKRIVIVKDSYANAFIPFLLPHFEKVYYIDPRYFKGNMIDFVKKQKITDVLFLNNSTVARNDGITKLLNEKMDVGK